MKSQRNIFQYLNYRDFIRDSIADLKVRNPRFSCRNFVKRIGMKSSGFLNLVLSGKRNLGINGIIAISNGLHLNESESRFFQQLVLFNQSTTHQEKQKHYEELKHYRHKLTPTRIMDSQYDAISSWIGPAILEMLRIPSSEPKTENWIMKNLDPQVSIRIIRRTLKALCDGNLIIRDANGYLVRRDPMLVSDDDVLSLAIRNYHQEVSRLAALKITQLDAEHREFSSLTLALTKDEFQLIREEMRKFRRKLHHMIEEKRGQTVAQGSVVTQLNLQLFPMTNTQMKKEIIKETT